VGGQRHIPAALPLGKTWYPLYRRLGGSQGRSGRMLKILPPPGFNPRTVQPVASCYTDCATPALITYVGAINLLSKRHLSVNFAWITQVLCPDGRKWKLSWLLCSPSVTQMLPATFPQWATKWMQTVAAASVHNSASLVNLLFDPHSETRGQHIKSFELSYVQNWFFCG